MIVVETFARGCQPRHRPTPAPAAMPIDTSSRPYRWLTIATTLAIPAGLPPAAHKLASIRRIGP